jgi:hypothetical protein
VTELRGEEFRASVTELVDGIQIHLEDRLDRVKDEAADLHRLMEQIELRLRYLEDAR